MTAPKSAFDSSQGSPALDALQYLQAQFTPAVIKNLERVCETLVSGSAGVDADIPVGAKIIDAHTICLKSNGSGSMTVKTGADTPVTISNAMACVTADALARATTIDTTYSIVGADGIKIFGNGAADYGAVYIKYKM